MPIFELFGDQDLDPIPIGVRSGALVHANRISGLDPATGDLPEDMGAQMRNAYANMRRCVENAGGSMDNVAHVSIFFADFARDRETMNPAWVEAFPRDDDRPTYKFMPARLPAGHKVQMEFHAVLDQHRHLLAVKGVAHTNPIPLGVKMGPYVFSSRMLPYDPATEKAAEGAAAQAQHLFQNTDALLKAGGLDWPDVWQGRAFLADPVHRPIVDRRWEERFPDATRRPPLNRVRYGGGALQVMLEVFAVRAEAR